MKLGFFTTRLAFLCWLGVAGSVTGTPFINSIDPMVGAPGDVVNISGSGFSPGTLVVKFHGVVDGTAATSDGANITAHVPTNATTGFVTVSVSGSSVDSSQQFTIIGYGPYISDISPNLGAANDFITINGIHFLTVTDVKFNGVAASFSVTSDSVINAYVPSGASTGPISVKNSVGTSNSPTFTVIGPGPYLSGFSPSAGGSGTAVQISGRFFTGVTNVQFNGTSVPGFPGPSSDTFISVNLPSGASSGLITLKAASGIGTSSTNFYVPPTVTSFSPPSGSAFSTVTVNGSSFIGATSVTFNGVPVQNPTVNAQGTQLTTSVPPTGTTGPIRVIAPAGSAQSTANFVVLPTITTFSPGSGPPGTLVTVNGYNFSSVTSVKFHGVSATTFHIVNSSQLTATVPAAATSGPISLTTPDGTVSSANSFYLPPGISSFTPNQGVWPQTVTISGTNFTGASAVRFAGTDAFNYNVDSDTSISAIVPTPNATSGAISVVTPGGTATSAANFYWPPSVSSFSPGHGLPFDQIAIFGVNLLGASQVFFNGTLTTNFSVINNGSMQARVPSGALTGPITVVAPAGTNTSSSSFVLDYSSDLYPTPTVSNTVTVGSNLVYTILIYNNGPNDAFNVRVTNTLPASVTLTSAYVTQGSLATNSNPIVGNLGTLAAFNAASILLTVVPHTVGLITNTTTVSSDYPDPAPGNNTSLATTRVLSLPLLSITSAVPRQVTVSWPNDLGIYFLQSKGVLSANFSWLNVTNLRQTNATSIYVTDGASNAAKFYRLTK